jgi:hypothetical protein
MPDESMVEALPLRHDTDGFNQGTLLSCQHQYSLSGMAHSHSNIHEPT